MESTSWEGELAASEWLGSLSVEVANIISIFCHSTAITYAYPSIQGYSWKTNQHGLTIDTITSYELVLPNGDIKIVTETSDEEVVRELFWGLKGGFNNFVRFHFFFLVECYVMC